MGAHPEEKNTPTAESDLPFCVINDSVSNVFFFDFLSKSIKIHTGGRLFASLHGTRVTF